MGIEILLVLAVIVVILLFFYRQSIKEFRILQTESLDKAMGLLHERSPIVVHPGPKPPTLWSRKDLKQRPALQKKLLPLLTSKTTFLKPKESVMYATELGLPFWVEQQVLPAFKTSQWWSPLLWAKTHVAIGNQGLRPTYAFYTVIVCTEGAIQVSLLNASSDPFLPKQWFGKRLSQMTRDDAPLLNQIQFVDVIVRPGSVLLVPPHWKVCWETLDSKEPALAMWIDLHHPISVLAHNAFYNTMKDL